MKLKKINNYIILIKIKLKNFYNKLFSLIIKYLMKNNFEKSFINLNLCSVAVFN